jgi:selT/selW/selH-like putative selenoprotein
LIPSSGGVFEVHADGRLLFSKKASGRFPEDAEILAALPAPR